MSDLLPISTINSKLTHSSSAIFQAGGLIVVLVEVARKAYLASIVPVIVNAILNEHQLVVDIVAFVNKGDFPRSRLNEKQRGKILAGWVSRKLRTIAQFAIKDMDREALRQTTGTSAGEPSPHQHGSGGVPSDEHHRASLGSLRSSSGGAPLASHSGAGSSSLRNVSSPPPGPQQQQQQHQILDQQRTMEPQQYYDLQAAGGARTPGPIEMPADEGGVFIPNNTHDNDQTPTKNYAQPPHMGFAGDHGFELPDFDQFGRDEAPPPVVGPKPGSAGSGTTPGGGGFGARPGTGTGIGGSTMTSQMAPQIRLPGVDGRESLDDWDLRPGSGGGGVGGRGGNGENGGEEDWMQDAYMSMNLAGTLGGK